MIKIRETEDMQQIAFKMSKPLPPRVGIICPSCGDEVSFREIVERRGYVGCTNCVK